MRGLTPSSLPPSSDEGHLHADCSPPDRKPDCLSRLPACPCRSCARPRTDRVVHHQFFDPPSARREAYSREGHLRILDPAHPLRLDVPIEPEDVLRILALFHTSQDRSSFDPDAAG